MYDDGWNFEEGSPGVLESYWKRTENERTDPEDYEDNGGDGSDEQWDQESWEETAVEWDEAEEGQYSSSPTGASFSFAD